IWPAETGVLYSPLAGVLVLQLYSRCSYRERWRDWPDEARQPPPQPRRALRLAGCWDARGPIPTERLALREMREGPVKRAHMQFARREVFLCPARTLPAAGGACAHSRLADAGHPPRHAPDASSPTAPGGSRLHFPPVSS